MRLVQFIRRSAPYCLVCIAIKGSHAHHPHHHINSNHRHPHHDHNLYMNNEYDQVPGAELGEGGSVVDLSHIAPSVLALIQVVSVIIVVIITIVIVITNDREVTAPLQQRPSMLPLHPPLSRYLDI